MLEGKYCQIINRFTKKVLVSGKIVNCKDIPIKCITFDNRYFFSLEPKFLYKIVFCEKCDTVKFDYKKYKNKIKPWRKSRSHKNALAYREYDISELDKEIECLVYALNDAEIETTGSCSGHNRMCAWVSIRFIDFDQIKWILSVLDLKDFNKKFVLTSDEKLINTNKKDIHLSLRTLSKGKKAYKDIKELAKYIKALSY